MKNIVGSLMLVGIVFSGVALAEGRTTKRTAAAPAVTESGSTSYGVSGYKHEVLLNSVGTQGFLHAGSGSTTFGLGGGYNYSLLESGQFVLQLGGTMGILTGGGTAFTILAGPTANLAYDGDMQNALFATFQLGIIAETGSTQFAFRLDAGKRFRIFDHFSYRPTIGLLYAGSAAFHANFLGASIEF